MLEWSTSLVPRLLCGLLDCNMMLLCWYRKCHAGPKEVTCLEMSEETFQHIHLRARSCILWTSNNAWNVREHYSYAIVVILTTSLSHRPPAWIFCNRIYHHYFYLHISVMLNKSAMGVMSIAMNVVLTNVHVCLVDSIQKNPSTMADNEWRSSCHHPAWDKLKSSEHARVV